MTEAAGDTLPKNPVPPVRWLARRVEPIIDPDYPIVDPRHRLFDSPMWRCRFDFREDLKHRPQCHNQVITNHLTRLLASDLFLDQQTGGMPWSISGC
jgi:hypothetical protein